MKMIKRILLFLCGALMASTGLTILVARVTIAMGIEVNPLSFIMLDLILASFLSFFLGGIVTMVWAMMWTDEKGGGQ